jgi:RNA polymerase sigma factor for flagellar operon FliA
MPSKTKSHFSTSERSKAIEELVPVVKQVARQVRRRLPDHIALDDIISSGMIGLVEAVDRFDPEKCGSIERYAKIRIRGAILDELRAQDWASRSLRKQAKDFEKSVLEISQELGRVPEAKEVAKHLKITLEEYHQLVNRVRPVMVFSLEDFGVKSENSRRSAIQTLADPKSINPDFLVHRKRLLDMIDGELNTMDERERVIVRMYYFKTMTLKQIGAMLDVTESRVSQILTQTMKILKARLGPVMEQEAERIAVALEKSS